VTSPITRADKAACLTREVKMRARAYPRWVGQGRMTQAQADREIAIMQAVLADYTDAPAPDLFGDRT
jgi:hypothetical protein